MNTVVWQNIFVKITLFCIRMTCYERITITVVVEDDTEEDVDDKYQLKSRKQA